MFKSGVSFLGVSVTPIHVGVGRSPSVVDLPVQRDPVGYPMIYGSSMKGALRELCRRMKGKCIDLFGSEPGVTPTSPGKIVVSDAIPFAYPIPVLETGYAYVTTPYLLGRLQALLDPLSSLIGGVYSDIEGEISDLITNLHGDTGDDTLIANEEFRHESIHVGAMRFKINKKRFNLDKLDSRLSAYSLTNGFSGKLLIANNKVGLKLVEKSLVRLTRVRLNPATKTVERNALWTEEYLPPLTIMLLAALGEDDSSINEFRRIVSKAKNYLVIGGKETIGKGLIKLVEIDGGSGGSAGHYQ